MKCFLLIPSLYVVKKDTIEICVNENIELMDIVSMLVLHQTDTFQAVLTTDGSKTYVVQLYQENSMLWDADQLNAAVTPVVGYRTSTSFFDLQTSESYSRAEMFRQTV